MQLGIGYDSFVRTTEPEHEAVVRQVLEAAWDKGDVYAADYEGWYCVDCEEYKDEADMDAGESSGGGVRGFECLGKCGLVSGCVGAS